MPIQCTIHQLVSKQCIVLELQYDRICSLCTYIESRIQVMPDVCTTLVLIPGLRYFLRQS